MLVDYSSSSVGPYRERLFIPGKLRIACRRWDGPLRLASLREIEVDQSRFPDLGLVRPLAVLAVDPFNICFPVARPLTARRAACP
jgi:hypothetical protein